MSISYSQLGQDVAVANFYHLRTNGYFIEVGAHDGINLSNTYMLETQFGWRGLCIEPLPSSFVLLEKNRKCHTIQTAVYSHTGLDLEFACNDGCGSAILKHIYPDVQISSKINVRTTTLTDIMDKYKVPSFVEYLSIDVEGSEIEVLVGIDWTRYSFGYISIEHNYIEPHRTEIRKVLEKQGYIHLRANQWDDDYIANNKETKK